MPEGGGKAVPGVSDELMFSDWSRMFGDYVACKMLSCEFWRSGGFYTPPPSVEVCCSVAEMLEARMDASFAFAMMSAASVCIMLEEPGI